MKEFKTKEDAIKYGEEKFEKYESEVVMIDGKKVALCCDDRCYEEDVWGKIYKALETLIDNFVPDESVDTDFVTDIRDQILEHFEEEYNITFVDVYDEY